MVLAEAMPVVEIDAPGREGRLRPGTRPRPAPAADEVLIAVSAAGVNRPDVLQRRGHYPPPPGISDVPGLEVAGVVAEVGAEVTRFKAGDRVCALLAGGGYAAFAAAPEAQCLPIPEGLTDVEAASLPETVFTVWNNVFDIGRFRPGDVVLIHGGTSGIGVTAIQMVKALGGRALATAGSAEKIRACRELGAEAAFNYQEDDFVAGVLEITDGRGADVVLDMVGGEYLERNIRACAEGARIVQIAFLKGKAPAVDLNLLMQRRVWITGSTLRSRPVAEKARLTDAIAQRVWPLYANGSIKPVVHAVFDVGRAAEAHALMESSQHIGKIVLTLA